MKQPDQLHFGEDASLVALKLAWDRALNALSSRVTRPLFETCLKSVLPVAYSDDRVVLGAATPFARYWIENKYLPAIQDLLSSHLGHPVKVSVLIRSDAADLPGTDEAELDALAAEPKPARSKPSTRPEYVLNEHFTFDTFVVGSCNQMAFATSQAVAKQPGASYSPLFIYGGSGVGKTHLLHAIGHFIERYHPDVGLTYTSGESFLCDYVTAVSERKTAQFRRRYRNVDVFLVDDVQFLAGKERTKEEFFHTFNALHEVGRQIVLSSDVPPDELELDKRLTSRFQAGLVVDIAQPDLETRMAIIQSKADKRDLQIPAEVVLYIARLIRSNIRVMEGALVKLHAYAAMTHEPVSTEMAASILSRYFEQPKEQIITPDTVMALVARHFDVSLAALNSASREREVVRARQVAMYLIRKLTDSSLPSIGRAFGGKDHSTVLHAIRKITKLVLQDASIADDVNALMKELRGSA